MSKEKSRRYVSSARQQQAADTQRRILAAAETLFSIEGFDGTTIEAIARKAGVAVPTVYSGFKSKRGIVLALLDQARFGEAYKSLVSEANDTGDARARLAVSARIARQIYEAEQATLDLVRGAAAVSPELAALVDAREESRRTPQRPLIEDLRRQGQLRPGLSVARAADIMWTLTSRELFRLLVIESRWPASDYESWLRDVLRRELCRDEPVG